MSFDPERIHLSSHAIERYMERRRVINEEEAVESMRRRLAAVCDQEPAIRVRSDWKTHRQYFHAATGYRWIVSTDNGTLITFVDGDHRTIPWKPPKGMVRNGNRSDRVAKARRRQQITEADNERENP